MIMILELQNEIKCTEDGYCSYRHNVCIFSKKKPEKIQACVLRIQTLQKLHL